MVSDASPGTADPKMNKSFVHTVHTSSDHARSQDGYFKCPYPTIIPHKSQKWIYKIKTLLIDKFSVSNVAFNVTQIHLVDLAVTLKC